MNKGWKEVAKYLDDSFKTLDNCDVQLECEERICLYLKVFAHLKEELNVFLKTSDRKDSQKSLIFEAVYLLKKPYNFLDTVSNLYESSFHVFKACYKDLFGELERDNYEEDIEDGECHICHQLIHFCRCSIILEKYSAFSQILADLGLFRHLLCPAIAKVAYQHLNQYIKTCCRGEYFDLWLRRIISWTHKGLLPWLQFITKCLSDGMDDESLENSSEEWIEQLDNFVYEVYAELRTSELFEIIVEYPDSMPSITDLKECLAKTDTRGHLTKSLKEAFTNRLLHPAVNTDDILTQYVSAIRTLRELDPMGVILENVCEPLREYLRGRNDTIKCIITCLTDQDTGPDLAEELLGTDNNAEEGESDGEDWEPDPIDAKTDLSSRKQRTADVINILVNIYGSQEMFVSQYRILLADRILTNFSYDVTNERRYLELLKRRFGENHLHFCDIMLKDIQASQRINRHIKDKLLSQDSIDFNAFILSSVFWPTLSNDGVDLPDQVKTLMDSYTDTYKQSKGSRTLEWFTNLGSVELEVELDDEARTFNVTPAQATLLLVFQRKDTWTLSELSKETAVTKSTLRARIAFWVGQGVIAEKSNDTFVTSRVFQSQLCDVAVCESDDDTATTSTQSNKDEDLHVYWSYIVGMLTNIGSLPLERIHSILKMFATNGDSSSQCSLEEVKGFLRSKVNSDELIYVGGVYKLPK